MEQLLAGGAVDQTQKAGHIVVSVVMVHTANRDWHRSNSKIIKTSCPTGTSVYKFPVLKNL